MDALSLEILRLSIYPATAVELTYTIKRTSCISHLLGSIFPAFQLLSLVSSFIPSYIFPANRRRTWRKRNRGSIPETNTTGSSWPKHPYQLCNLPSLLLSGYRGAFARVKAARREGHDLPHYSAEGKNALSCICIPPSALVSWCLIKHTNDFTFYSSLTNEKSVQIRNLRRRIYVISTAYHLDKQIRLTLQSIWEPKGLHRQVCSMPAWYSRDHGVKCGPGNRRHWGFLWSSSITSKKPGYFPKSLHGRFLPHPFLLGIH